MLNILANDGMDKEAVQQLEAEGHSVDTNFYEGDALVGKLRRADVVVIRSKTKIRKDLIDKIKDSNLKLIIRAGVGIDNIDHLYAEEQGIAVRNTPNSSSDSVAELVLGHIFTLARHLHQSNVTMKKGEWNKNKYTGSEINGKTLGLIGFGRIAKSLARKAKLLGMTVRYFDVIGINQEESEFQFMSFDDILKNSDYVSIHIPFSKDEKAILSTEEFAMMKKSAYLINCARGGVVDEAALVKALDAGELAGAALDVFEDEPAKNETILQHEKISLSPHIGASTEEAQKRIGEETVRVIQDFFR